MHALFAAAVAASVVLGPSTGLQKIGTKLKAPPFTPPHAKAGPTGAYAEPPTYFPVRPRSSARLRIENVSPYLDALTVLPGERVPLRVVDERGTAVPVTWRAHGGQLAWGAKMAIWMAPLRPGAYALRGHGLVAGRLVQRNLTMIVTVPVGNVHEGKLNGYPIGNYPKGLKDGVPMLANRGSRDAYDVPSGFVEVTAANADMRLSEHYKLGDFVGKDDHVAGKKYMFLNPRLIEKLERLIDVMRAEGYDCDRLQIMSGYRSPHLNSSIGNVTTLSRHTYGDAADMLAKDFNRDGKADATDAKLLLAAITKLDTESDLTGGACIYPPNSAHGYFVHTDTRGALVRW